MQAEAVNYKVPEMRIQPTHHFGLFHWQAWSFSITLLKIIFRIVQIQFVNLLRIFCSFRFSLVGFRR